MPDTVVNLRCVNVVACDEEFAFSQFDLVPINDVKHSMKFDQEKITF